MKKRFLSKIGAAILAASMLMSTVSPVFAAGYTPTTGGTMSFDKYLVMDKDLAVPDASFTYTIAAGESDAGNGISAGIGTVTMAGVGTSEPNTIAVHSTDSTSSNAGSLPIKDFNGETQKYVAKTAALDFSGCSFTEPGIYRYILTENDSTDPNISNDSAKSRIIDVYVINDPDSDMNLKVSSYVMHTSGNLSENKNQGFTNKYTAESLSFTKAVSGNQASKDKYFKYTVTLSNTSEGKKYAVDITNASATVPNNSATDSSYVGKTNATEIEVPAGETSVTKEFYLQHGQVITIKGLENGTGYSVTEEKEDYISTPSDVTGYTDATTGTIATNSVKTSYTNTKSGVIPTGVVMSVAPFAALTLIAGFGLVFMTTRRRRDE